MKSSESLPNQIDWRVKRYGALFANWLRENRICGTKNEIETFYRAWVAAISFDAGRRERNDNDLKEITALKKRVKELESFINDINDERYFYPIF